MAARAWRAELELRDLEIWISDLIEPALAERFDLG